MCIVGWGPGAADGSQVFVPSGSQSLVLAYSGVGGVGGGLGNTHFKGRNCLSPDCKAAQELKAELFYLLIARERCLPGAAVTSPKRTLF